MTRLIMLFAIGALLPPMASAETLSETPRATDLGPAIIVTARKIEEDPQAIPMSVQVLSGEFLDATGTTRLHELQFAVPGLVINSTGLAGIGFSLRGIADQRVTGLSVAPHLNGVYLGTADLATARLFDLERIEVLKGPQGTLYGRNSTGGSINFITRSPQDAFSADIEAAYGSFETTRLQGHVNLPLENSAVRLAFVASEGDGYIRNSVDNRRFAAEDYWGMRGTLRIVSRDDLRIDVMVQHVRDDGASGELWSPNPEFLANPKDIRLTTVTLANPYLISEVDNLSINTEYELGFALLRSITGYARSEVRDLDDCAGVPFLRDCVRGVRPSAYEQWSQELQLIFPRKGFVEGLVGAYYSEADASIKFHQLLPVFSPQPLNDLHSTRSEPAAAVFGQLTLHPTDRWSATAGLRLSREKQRITTIGTGLEDSHTLLVGHYDSDDLSWRLDLEHRVTEDVLVYANVSTGHKSGGFVLTTLSDGDPDRFEPEYLTAFEAGGRSRWLEGRLTLNAAAFFYDFEDLQVSTTILGEDGLTNDVGNAAQAELYGIDGEGSFQVTDRWSAHAGVVWLPMREFVEYQDEVTGDTLSGNKLVRAPEWTATAALALQQPLREWGGLSARLEYAFRSGFFYTQENLPEFSQESFGLLNLHLRFDAADESWYLFASGRNLTNQDYFNQVFLQSSPGHPDTYEIGFGLRF